MLNLDCSKELSPIFCEHANEVPLICNCPVDCYCKQHTCKDNITKTIKRNIRGVVKCNVCKDYVCSYCETVKRCTVKGCIKIVCEECCHDSPFCDDHTPSLCQV